MGKLVVGADERSVAVQRDVVDTPVPDASIAHAVRRESEDSSDDGTGQDVVPVVILVDSKGTTNKAGTENGGIDRDELPHGGVVVGEDLQLGVEV